MAQTRVLLNTAGPFARYGDPIVDACIRFQTHYVDITGETTWVRGLIDRYHERASTDGTRIIPGCGFDSVPADLGSYLIVRQIRWRSLSERKSMFGVPCREVKAYYQISGGVNGGTLASNSYRYESGQIELGRDPFVLNPHSNHSPAEIERNRDPSAATFDRSLGTWVGPFVMGEVNTRVVRRSAALFEQWGEPYSPQFHYQEYTKYNPPWAGTKAVIVTNLMSLLGAAFAGAATRRWLERLLPQPGTGPSEQAINSGWFITKLLGIAVDGREVRGTIRYQGDPGNRATVCFVCESALSLALDNESLPGGYQRGGILTPATGLGDILVERLRTAGLSIEIPDRSNQEL